jgi:hypothetical protein
MEERFLKITNGAYKVLDFFPEQDPLKNKAKEKALVILESLPIVLATDGWASLQKEKALSQLLVDIDVFLSYLLIAKSQKWIDNINYLILSKEYKDIETEAKSLIKKDEFSNILLDKLKNKNIKQVENLNNKQNLDNQNLVETKQYKGLLELTERQKKILEILQNNEKTQVSDIIKFLPDITKRTIRRDLDGLLEMGKVVRVGEWNQIFYQVMKGENLPKSSENETRTVILS